MSRYLRSTVILLAIVGLGAVSCGDDGGPTETAASQVRATVRTDGVAASGVTVRLYASGGATAQAETATNSNGQATFSDLSAGSYDVEVVVPADLELESGVARRPVTVTAGQTATVTFDLVDAGNVEEVTLSGVSFSPANLTIAPGTTVRWRNTEPVFHTITPDGHSQWSRATVSNVGDTFTHTFNTAGEFPYFCEPHLSQGMTGTITVQ